MFSDSYRLCYVTESQAYFTAAPIVGPSRQRGVDWGTGSYRDSEPPDVDGETVISVMYDGDLCTDYSTPLCVYEINQGNSPWLLATHWPKGGEPETIEVWAGDTFSHFVAMVRLTNGNVYVPLAD